MTWVRFDDATAEHPKFAALGDYAPLCGWLWFSADCYCGRYLTDGKVDIVTLRRLWPFKHIGVATGGVPGMFEVGEDPTADDLVKLLVSARLFDEIEPGLYRVHDYLKYNPSRAEVLQARRNKKKAGQAGGQASAQARATAHAQGPASRLLEEGLNPRPRTTKERKEVDSPPTPQPPTQEDRFRDWKAQGRARAKAPDPPVDLATELAATLERVKAKFTDPPADDPGPF